MTGLVYFSWAPLIQERSCWSLMSRYIHRRLYKLGGPLPGFHLRHARKRYRNRKSETVHGEGNSDYRKSSYTSRLAIGHCLQLGFWLDRTRTRRHSFFENTVDRYIAEVIFVLIDILWNETHFQLKKNMASQQRGNSLPVRQKSSSASTSSKDSHTVTKRQVAQR